MGALFVFSFTNKSSFEEVDTALSRLSHSSTASGDVCPLVVGTRYGAVSESEVTSADVLRFEAKWNRCETWKWGIINEINSKFLILPHQTCSKSAASATFRGGGCY